MTAEPIRPVQKVYSLSDEYRVKGKGRKGLMTSVTSRKVVDCVGMINKTGCMAHCITLKRCIFLGKFNLCPHLISSLDHHLGTATALTIKLSTSTV
jgi:hypothetical protein